MKYFGIDFGTSNSSIAFFDDESKILEVVSPALPAKLPGGRVYPSVVGFDRLGNMMAAGWFAEGHRHAFPNLAVDLIKRWIGKPYIEILSDFRLENLGYKIIEVDKKAVVQIGNKIHHPEEIVAYFLKHMLEEGIAYLKEKGVNLNGEKVTLIVTHPAYYLQNQVEAIRDAVDKMKKQTSDIDFEHVKLIPEPIASVCTAMYFRKLDREDRFVMVIDEGAGTLDTMLVDMEMMSHGMEDEIEAKGVTIGGNNMLGGVDMDIKIVEWVLEELRKDKEINLEELKKINKQTLRRDAESAKIDISERRTEAADINVQGFSKVVKLRESQLNTLISPVIVDCKMTILKSLNIIEEQHKIQRDYITKVILVGGPTRIKMFRDMVNGYFFSWDEVPGNDSKRLIEYLERYFDTDCLSATKIEKIDDGKVIRVSNKNNYLLILNDEKNRVKLKIDDKRTDEFIAKTENGKLNIYGILKAEIVDINPMECVAIGAAVSQVVRYKVPADRTYGLLKKEDGTKTFIKAVSKDTPLPESVVMPWKVEAFETNIPIEVAQVIEERMLAENKKEMVCLTMGKYVYSAPLIEKTYFIVFKLDDERKVEVIVTDSNSRAEEYSKGINKKIQKGDFRVELRREMGTCVVEEHDKPPNPLFNFFFENAPQVHSELGAANKVLEESKRIINFGIEESKLKDLFQSKTDTGNVFDRIMQNIHSKLAGINIDGDTIPEDVKAQIKNFINEISMSEDFAMLFKKKNALEKKVEDIKYTILYDKSKITDLINRISYTKTDALTGMQKLRDRLSHDTISEAEHLLDGLDKIQGFLETKNEMLADSMDGEMYRDGERKEQMLRNLVEQRIVPDREED